MKLIALILSLFVATSALAQQRPGQAEIKRSRTEIRAFEEFTAGRWDKALPLLQKVAKELRDTGQIGRAEAVEEAIRVCERNLGKRSDLPAGPPSAEERKPHAAPAAGEVRDLTIQQLGNFQYDADEGGNIPDDVQALSGSAIRVRGYMIPMDQADSITQFVLVPSLFACCFGQAPTVQHTIVVNMPKGKGVGYYPDEIVVEGKLLVEEKKEDDFIISVFEMEASSVKPSDR